MSEKSARTKARVVGFGSLEISSAHGMKLEVTVRDERGDERQLVLTGPRARAAAGWKPGQEVEVDG